RCIWAPNLQTRGRDKTPMVRFHTVLVFIIIIIFWHEQQINVEENLKYEDWGGGGGKGVEGSVLYKTGKETLMHPLVDHYRPGRGKSRICNKG
ncbi:unnamed protein product, partial [Ixodes persulcatus]